MTGQDQEAIVLELTGDISLRVICEWTDNSESVCEILLHNMPTGITVKGKYLEEAVRVCEETYLLLTTDGVIFEEGLFIYLVKLGEYGKVLEKVSIAQMYCSGFFKDIKIVSNSTIEFYFLGEKPWRVKVLKRPEFAFPFISGVPYVWRSFSFKKYLSVYEMEF